MERDLQTIGKISKYYNLEPKLKNKAKNFILNNQQNNEDNRSHFIKTINTFKVVHTM